MVQLNGHLLFAPLNSPPLFTAILDLPSRVEGHHDHMENGRNEAREEGLKSEASWLQDDMPFTVDTDVTGGYSITNVAKMLDGGKLLNLKDGAFRPNDIKRDGKGTAGWMDR